MTEDEMAGWPGKRRERPRVRLAARSAGGRYAGALHKCFSMERAGGGRKQPATGTTVLPELSVCALTWCHSSIWESPWLGSHVVQPCLILCRPVLRDKCRWTHGCCRARVAGERPRHQAG